MRSLSENSVAIFNRLLQFPQGKIKNNDVFMPLHVEHIYTWKDKKVYSLAHYGECNGDLMKDPEMTFLIDSPHVIYPLTYANDWVGKFSTGMYLMTNGLKIPVKGELEDLVEFANKWLLNIYHQQDLE